jgi:hypothetical protein
MIASSRPNLVQVALGLASLSFIGCAISAPDIAPHQANEVSLDPRDWYVLYSANMASHPSAEPNAAWSFEFPSAEAGGHVNYVQTPFNATTPLHNVVLTFRVESDTPQYEVADSTDILPATVRLFFEQQNDDLRDPNGRWWATASKYDLGSQDNTAIRLTVPLTPDQWTNVYGERDPNAFYGALDNVGWIGVTFGGQYFFGHGVALRQGTAKYVLVDLKVN